MAKRSPRKVKTRDFVDPDGGKGIPYGVYDIGRVMGWVNVGCDHETANFAVESIRRWWDAGKVVEIGTRQKLMQARGYFYNFVNTDIGGNGGVG